MCQLESGWEGESEGRSLRQRRWVGVRGTRRDDNDVCDTDVFLLSLLSKSEKERLEAGAKEEGGRRRFT